MNTTEQTTTKTEAKVKTRVNLDRPARRTSEVTRLLHSAGYTNAELVQGNGYLYFCIDEPYFDRSVAVCYVSHMTLREWLAEFDSVLVEFRAMYPKGDASVVSPVRIN